MKLYKGLLFTVLTTLTFAANASASAANTTSHYTGDGLMECGLYYYPATLTSLPEKLLLTGSNYPAVVHFHNTQAEAVCGGEIVNSKKVSQDQGKWPYKLPRFLKAETVKEASASIFDRRALTVGKSYKIACVNSLVSAKVVEIRRSSTSLVSFRFENPRAEELCGSDRFHNMGKILDRTEALQQAQLGFK